MAVNLDNIIIESLSQQLELLKDDLIKKHIELGQKASGDWIKGLKVVVDSEKGILYGEDYTEFLTVGRKPNKDQSPEALRAFAGWGGNTWAKKWVQDKGVNISPFAVAYKIGRDGTDIYEEGGTDLIDAVITKERISKIENEIGKSLIVSISELILR